MVILHRRDCLATSPSDIAIAIVGILAELWPTSRPISADSEAPSSDGNLPDDRRHSWSTEIIAAQLSSARRQSMRVVIVLVSVIDTISLSRGKACVTSLSMHSVCVCSK